MTNGICPLNKLKVLDSYIRGKIIILSKAKDMQISFFTGWGNSGLRLKLFQNKHQILTI